MASVSAELLLDYPTISNSIQGPWREMSHEMANLWKKGVGIIWLSVEDILLKISNRNVKAKRLDKLFSSKILCRCYLLLSKICAELKTVMYENTATVWRDFTFIFLGCIAFKFSRNFVYSHFLYIYYG